MDLEMEPCCPEEENSRCRIPARFVMKVNQKPKEIKFLTPLSNGGFREEEEDEECRLCSPFSTSNRLFFIL